MACFSVLLLPFGLLPLIKGSLIPNVIISLFAILWLSVAEGFGWLALVSLVAPSTALVVFWCLSGQSMGGIIDYFSNMTQVVVGYTEAMATEGDFREVIIYLGASAAILYIVLTGPVRLAFKISSLIVFSVFLFTAFKGGFVRHDGHALIAAEAIIIAPIAASLSILKPSRGKASLLWLAVAAWFIIEAAYIRSPTAMIYYNLLDTYTHGVEGISTRAFNPSQLGRDFARSVAAIAEEGGLPKIEGTADIYSFDQSYLLASRNKWNPRPVLQSYSAYTRHLAAIDRDHLESSKAAENIFFKLQPIDDRYPSLDDGPSWPVMLDNYRIANDSGNYLSLRRTQQYREPAEREIASGRYKLGENVDLPKADLLYARLDIRPTLVGSLALALYKTPRLTMRVTTVSNQIASYRIVSGMARAGFLLSPLVSSTDEFEYLFKGPTALVDRQVRSIKVEGNPLFWANDYSLAVGELAPAAEGDQVIAGDVAPEEVSCQGSIDHINGQTPASLMKLSGLVSFDGWMILSGKDETIPDAVYVTLEDRSGRIVYAKTRKVQREDVKDALHLAKIGRAGFAGGVDVSNLAGVVLGLARRVGSHIERCENFRILLSH